MALVYIFLLLLLLVVLPNLLFHRLSKSDRGRNPKLNRTKTTTISKQNTKSASRPTPTMPPKTSATPGVESAILPTAGQYYLKYPSSPLTLHVTTYNPAPPIKLIYTHGGGNEMKTFMNHYFALGFASMPSPSGVIGFDRHNRPGAPMFEELLKNQPEIHAIAGRSAGSTAAVNAVLGARGRQVTHLIILSYPFSADYNDRLLLRLPKGLKILFILGDRDDFGRQNAQGRSLDNAYKWIDEGFDRGERNVWKMNLRHGSHGSNVPGPLGGRAASDAILIAAGKVASVWLKNDAQSSEVMGRKREGVVWYDLAEKDAFWSEWQPKAGLAEAAAWGI